jgi:hypothetical protein
MSAAQTSAGEIATPVTIRFFGGAWRAPPADSRPLTIACT